MDAPSSLSPSLQSHQFPFCLSTVETQIPICIDSNQTVVISPAKPINDNNNNEKKKKNKKVKNEDVPFAVQSLSSCSSSSPNPTQKITRLACKRRSPIVRFGAVRRTVGARDVEAMALPLGMSFAAFVNLVLDRKDSAGQSIPYDDLPMICTSAVRESLANVYGDKFACFVKNFERSFGSTLRTLRLINESSLNKRRHHDLDHLNLGSSTSEVTFNQKGCSLSNFGIKDSQEEMDSPSVEAHSLMNTSEEIQGNMSMDSMNLGLVAFQGNMDQLACVSQSSVVNQMSTIEKSIIEQTRANDLKTLELGITMKKLSLKEEQLALNYDSNHLERSKIAMGKSKASFKAEKFKNQLEDMRHAELLKKCVDCLVAGLLIMAVSLSYSAYVYSYRRITEATASCIPPPQESSWWIPKPMASFNSGWHTLKCQVQVVSRMLFGLLLILAVTYLLLQRSAAPKQTMPITFILLLLGIVCGFTGKLCVDALGGSGYHWLLFWETLCLMHFFSNICTSALFLVLYGPIDVSEGTKCNAMIPYWIRRFLFYALVFLFLPLFCGLMPFASMVEWKDHFSQLLLDFSVGD